MQRRPGECIIESVRQGCAEVVKMAAIGERYVVDKTGERVGVLLAIEDYRKLLEELEELESVRAFDAAKASSDEAIPFEQAIEEIERHGR